MRNHGAERVGRYVLVSGICVVIQNVVLISADRAGLPYELAILLSTAILLPTGFFLQSHCTFSVDKTFAAFVRYAGTMVSALPISMALAWVFCGLLRWPMFVASPAISLCLFCWNYAVSSWALAHRSAVTQAA